MFNHNKKLMPKPVLYIFFSVSEGYSGSIGDDRRTRWWSSGRRNQGCDYVNNKSKLEEEEQSKAVENVSVHGRWKWRNRGSTLVGRKEDR